MAVGFKVEVEKEDDRRWIAEVTDLPGVMVYGPTQKAAITKAQALALRVLADRIEHGEKIPAIANHFVVPRALCVLRV
ncbi:MAG TPA: type II toxin-antitoxin system HicB family antitoxin [Phycisphaerae bacterium]|nr:type II toxin-antitoxin system HicB family antitoxin [Phycisphaerae bacterium]